MLLYKYLAAERVDVLADRRLRFTPPPLFNDPFESSPVLHDDVLPEDWRRVGEIEGRRAGMPQKDIEHLSKAEVRSALFPRALEIMMTLLRGRVGILSLTERPDNLLMWAYYASQHSGLAIGFDSEHPWFGTPPSDRARIGVVQKVDYALRRPKVGLTELSLLQMYFTKSVDWAHEQEWRLFRNLDEASVVEEGANAIHLFEFPAEAVKCVVLGCRVSEETRHRIRCILEHEEYRHVSVMQASLHAEEYRLVLEAA